MKIRWTDSSIRLRITPAELDALAAGAAVDESLELNGGRWGARLAVRDGVDVLFWNGTGPHVAIGRRALEALLDPESEGVYLTLGDPPCRVIVEKDFPCAHPHAPGTCEPHTERFAPTPSYLARKYGGRDAGGLVAGSADH